MSNEWLNMLDAEGVGRRDIAASQQEAAGFVAAKTPQLCDLAGYAIYEVTGADATAFLQGQFCNDIAQLSSTQAQITGYCTPKGRLLALPTILGFDSGYRMLVPADVAPAFIKRLSMFVMRSDVVIRQMDNWVATGIVASPDGETGLAGTVLGALPVGVLSVASTEKTQLIRWHDDNSGERPRARYLRLASVSDQLQMWQLASDAPKRSGNVWRLADISAGVPGVTQGVVEAFVPQMVNLQLINGLSFTKGCYPGQEIVARMQYLGKLKRHMRLFRVSLENLELEGADVLVAGRALGSGTDENAGVVVDAMPLSAAEALVLAVTKVTTANGEDFSLAGEPLHPLDMPYELPSLEVA